MKFLIDQCVDDAVDIYLRKRGYECHKVRDVSAPNAPDPLIAFLAESEGLIIVTHDKHFKEFEKMVSRFGLRKPTRGAGVILLRVKENEALDRLIECFEAIPILYELSLQRRIRMQIRISASGITLTDNAPLD